MLSLMLLKETMKKRCNKYYLLIMDSVLKKNDKEEIQIYSLKDDVYSE